MYGFYLWFLYVHVYKSIFILQYFVRMVFFVCFIIMNIMSILCVLGKKVLRIKITKIHKAKIFVKFIVNNFVCFFFKYPIQYSLSIATQIEVIHSTYSYTNINRYAYECMYFFMLFFFYFPNIIFTA